MQLVSRCRPGGYWAKVQGGFGDLYRLEIDDVSEQDRWIYGDRDWDSGYRCMRAVKCSNSQMLLRQWVNQGRGDVEDIERITMGKKDKAVGRILCFLEI